MCHQQVPMHTAFRQIVALSKAALSTANAALTSRAPALGRPRSHQFHVEPSWRGQHAVERSLDTDSGPPFQSR